jgi:hypothetical protein
MVTPGLTDLSVQIRTNSEFTDFLTWHKSVFCFQQTMLCNGGLMGYYDHFRLACSDSRQSITSKAAPASPKKHSELLREFGGLYNWSFKKSIYSALRVPGSMENFDYQNQIMHYDLHYRPICGGNPGLAFTLTDAAFRSSEEIDLNSAFVLQLAQSGILSIRLSLPDKKDFVGLVVALFTTENDFIFRHYPIFRHSPKVDADIATLRHDIWLRELQRNIDGGLILRLGGDQPGARLGHMKADKSKKWSRAPLSIEEVAAMGLPTMAAFVSDRSTMDLGHDLKQTSTETLVRSE